MGQWQISSDHIFAVVSTEMSALPHYGVRDVSIFPYTMNGKYLQVLRWKLLADVGFLLVSTVQSFLDSG